jgi:hypothetical protein
VLGVVLLCCAGCINAPRNPNCAWSDEPGMPLDLNQAAHQRHLNADARVAEELAIRHADATRGHRSGQYAGPDEYHRTRDECLAALSREISSRHQLQPSQVADAVGRRDGRLDALVMLIFAALYGWVANGAARRLFVRFPPDEPWPALIGTAAAAAFVSAAGVIAGWLGSAVVEMAQVGDTHLSYRADRMPWERHWLPLFCGAAAVFCCIAAAQWRGSKRRLISDVERQHSA